MDYVSSFEREISSPYYKIVACNKGNELQCRTLPFQYHLVVNDSGGFSNGPFIGTKSGKYVFISKDEINSPTAKRWLGIQKCWMIDPCTPSIADFCCNPTYKQSPYRRPFEDSQITSQETESPPLEKKNHVSNAFLIVFIIVASLLLISFILVLVLIR
jgi:hypothetical protein